MQDGGHGGSRWLNLKDISKVSIQVGNLERAEVKFNEEKRIMQY